MKSLILQVMVRALLPILLMFSIFLLLRGHNSPGGGFAGGLIAGAVFILFALVVGVDETRRALRIDPMTILASGLLLAFLSGIIGWLQSDDFLQAWWWSQEIELIKHAGTPLIFDLGVYLTVLGSVLTIVLTLIEEA